MMTPLVRLAAFTTLLCILGAAQPAPLRVGIVGLVHGHAAGFLSGGALAPAGGAMNRPDVQIVGVVEPDDQVYGRYASHYHWPESLRFHSIEEMASKVHPVAVLVFTSTEGHREVVEHCAKLGIHVMMEKPLTVSYKDALAMQDAARRGNIHVLVDYETTWYASNHVAYKLAQDHRLGEISKAVFRDGHQGPAKIGVQPEFLKWLTDPRQNGAGALYDFGCYGTDLMTWFEHGERPSSVMAVTKRLQPSLYPQVDDEADILLNYRNAVAIIQASWDWPFGVKDMDLYGATGYAKTNSRKIETRFSEKDQPESSTAEALKSPYDDPLHYLAAVIAGQIQEGDDPSSLKTNVAVAEILDAARESARTGRQVSLQH